MGRDQEIAALVNRLNQQPDKLHSDNTPAVNELIAIGVPVLEQVLPLMLGENRDTRLRALRVTEMVTMKLHGFRPGSGWLRTGDEHAWRELWKAMGELTADAPASARAAAVGRWMEWLRAQDNPLSK
jgi:hypothetical protein